MWRRRDPGQAQQPASEPEASSPEPVEPPPRAEPPREPEDPYAALENIFADPIVLEDVPAADEPPGPKVSAEPRTAAAADAAAAPSPASGAAGETAQRLWARLDAIEREVQGGATRTLEALRRLGERVGAELAMLDKRAVNLELTVARLRAATEAMEASLRRGTMPPAPERPSPPPLDASAAAPDGGVTPAEPAASTSAPPPAPEAGSLFPPDAVRPDHWPDDPTD